MNNLLIIIIIIIRLKTVAFRNLLLCTDSLVAGTCLKFLSYTQRNNVKTQHTVLPNN